MTEKVETEAPDVIDINSEQMQFYKKLAFAGIGAAAMFVGVLFDIVPIDFLAGIFTSAK